MEPPVNLLRIRETLDARLRRTAADSGRQAARQQEGLELERLESLYWVAFAAQRSAFDAATGLRTSRPSTGLSRLKNERGKGLIVLLYDLYVTVLSFRLSNKRSEEK